MKRVAAVLVAAAILAGAAPGAAAPPVRGTAIGVGLSEWEVSVYRTKVPAGKVRFNITNLGEDGHNFVVRGPAGKTIKTVEELPAGGRTTAPAKLGKPGRYTLVCTLAGHEDLGMKSYLKVTKPKRR